MTDWGLVALAGVFVVGAGAFIAGVIVIAQVMERIFRKGLEAGARLKGHEGPVFEEDFSDENISLETD